MAGNALPDDENDLLALAEDIADGLETLEAGVGVKQNTEAVIRGSISAYRTAGTQLGGAKSARGTASGAVDAADAQAKGFVKEARKVLQHYCGDSFNPAWEATGFPNQSTAVPGKQEERMNLCDSLKTYFTDNPTQESAQFGVTAVKAGERFDGLSDARDDFDAKNSAVTTKTQALAAALKTLKKRVRGLIDELGTLLEDDDPRWHEFGLSMPADPDTPEKVKGLVLTPNVAGAVMSEWKRAPRAGRYRIFKQVLTVDLVPVNVQTMHDLQFMIDGLPSGKTVRVTIVAANDAGEAPASDPVDIVVP